MDFGFVSFDVELFQMEYYVRVEHDFGIGIINFNMFLPKQSLYKSHVL